MAETLPRDDESARRLAALTADMDVQVRQKLLAYYEKTGVMPRLVDNVSRSTNPPGHKQAWTRGQRHHRREFGYED